MDSARDWIPSVIFPMLPVQENIPSLAFQPKNGPSHGMYVEGRPFIDVKVSLDSVLLSREAYYYEVEHTFL